MLFWGGKFNPNSQPRHGIICIKLPNLQLLFVIPLFLWHYSCDIIPLFLWRYSLIPVTLFPYSYDIIPLFLWHNSLILVTLFPYSCDIIPLFLWHYSLIPVTLFLWHYSLIPVMLFPYSCDIISLFLWCYSLIPVTLFPYSCDGMETVIQWKTSQILLRGFKEEIGEWCKSYLFRWWIDSLKNKAAFYPSNRWHKGGNISKSVGRKSTNPIQECVIWLQILSSYFGS